MLIVKFHSDKKCKRKIPLNVKLLFQDFISYSLIIHLQCIHKSLKERYLKYNVINKPAKTGQQMDRVLSSSAGNKLLRFSMMHLCPYYLTQPTNDFISSQNTTTPRQIQYILHVTTVVKLAREHLVNGRKSITSIKKEVWWSKAVVSGCAEWNGEGEVISNLPPPSSEMLEYCDPRCQHRHPH